MSRVDGAAGRASVMIDDLLKWERSLAVATWERKAIPAERYRRQRDAARSALESLIASRSLLSTHKDPQP